MATRVEEEKEDKSSTEPIAGLLVPMLTDGLLFKLAGGVCAVYERLFGGHSSHSDLIQQPGTNYPFCGACCL